MEVLKNGTAVIVKVSNLEQFFLDSFIVLNGSSQLEY